MAARLLALIGLILGLILLAPAVLAGGLLGSWLGARRLGTLTLRRTLAVVLGVASAKLLSE